MTVSGLCCIEGCRNKADRQTPHGPLCSTHRRRTQPSRAGGKDVTAPVEERLPPGEYLRRMALELADAEADVAYARAEGELDKAALAMGKAKLADERLKRAAVRYGSDLAKKEHGESVRRGQLAAKEAGVRLGRPPALDFEAAQHAVKTEGSIKAAAFKLGLAYETVRKALRRPSKVQVVSAHGSLHTLSRPPPSGDSEE